MPAKLQSRSGLFVVEPWSDAARYSFEGARERWGSSLAYEQNWLYLRQVMRRGGWVLSNEHGWAAISRDYVAPGRHALVTPVTHNLPRFLPEVLLATRRREYCPTLYKHIPANEARALADSGVFRICTRAYLDETGTLESFSEDRFPQVTLNMAELQWSPESGRAASLIPALPLGHCNADFRHQIRRFAAEIAQFAIRVEEIDIREAPSGAIDRMLTSWLSSVVLRYGAEGRPLVRSYEDCFRRPIEAVLQTLKEAPDAGCGRLLLVNGEPTAHWTASRIRGGGFGVYTLSADTQVPNLAHYTLYSAIIALKDSGAQTINLGGSELRSLFHFKTRLRSCEPDRSKPGREVVEMAAAE